MAIGSLPKSLTISGKPYEIRSDFRIGLNIIQAFTDPELSKKEKIEVLLICLYKDYMSIPEESLQEAVDKAIWFLDCGQTSEHKSTKKPLYDFEQDEQIIFSAVNKVAGMEVRSCDYIHFWTFMGYFNEIGKGTFATVVSIRDKQRRHKKLEKEEREFIRDNPDIVNLKRKYTQEEKDELKMLDDLLG